MVNGGIGTILVAIIYSIIKYLQIITIFLRADFGVNRWSQLFLSYSCIAGMNCTSHRNISATSLPCSLEYYLMIQYFRYIDVRIGTILRKQVIELICLPLLPFILIAFFIVG